MYHYYLVIQLEDTLKGIFLDTLLDFHTVAGFHELHDHLISQFGSMVIVFLQELWEE